MFTVAADDSSGGSELEEWGEEEGSEEDPGYAEYYSFNDDEGRASQVLSFLKFQY
jgi:hypothetical protein